MYSNNSINVTKLILYINELYIILKNVIYRTNFVIFIEQLEYI